VFLLRRFEHGAMVYNVKSGIPGSFSCRLEVA